MKNKRIIQILAIILISIIPISFLYSLIVLLVEPSKFFIVENRKNLQPGISYTDIL